jgi:hypothetical protein
MHAESYAAMPILLAFWIVGYAWKRTLPKRASEIDLDTGRKSWLTVEDMRAVSGPAHSIECRETSSTADNRSTAPSERPHPCTFGSTECSSRARKRRERSESVDQEVIEVLSGKSGRTVVRLVQCKPCRNRVAIRFSLYFSPLLCLAGGLSGVEMVCNI